VTDKDASPSAEHEALCRRCGRCCYEKLIVDGHVFTTRTPCLYLDVATNFCNVYERRLAINPRCLSVEQGTEFGVFPADCPYVRDLQGYHPAEEGWLDDEIIRMIERGKLFNADDIITEMQRRNKQS